MTTIITLIVLVSVGIVTVDGECQTNNGPIETWCCVGYNNNYNVNSGRFRGAREALAPPPCNFKKYKDSMY